MTRACSTNGEKRNVYKLLMGSPERKRPLGIPKCRWMDNIEMCLRKMGWGGMDCIDLLGVRTIGGILWTRYGTFGFHEMKGRFWVAAGLASSLEGLSPMELAS
jgi:hypothetical protein